jgi:phosphoribosyl-ATP pyrophosphohydrolase
MESGFLGSALSKKDMVSLSQRQGITLQANADIELRGFYAFVFGELVDLSTADDIPHLNLLRAISNQDKKAFEKQIDDLEKRQINDDSVWSENDALMFLFLVGLEIFDVRTELIEKVLEAREKNTNPAARKVNQVFRALSRKEYGMEGEYSFIKIVFLKLSGKLTLTSENSRQPYLSLVRSGLLDELSPFLQVLAIRAFDLILFNREPQKFENYSQILEGIENLDDKLSFRQAIRLLFRLPAKFWISAISVLFALLLFVFGAGQRFNQWSLRTEHQLKAPRTLSVTNISNPAQAHTVAVKVLATNLLSSRQAVPGKHLIVVAVESSQFGTSTPPFSVELSHVGSPVLDGYAFTVNGSDETEILSILPTLHTIAGLQGIVPKSDEKTKIMFAVLLEVLESEEPTEHQFVLRSFD